MSQAIQLTHSPIGLGCMNLCHAYGTALSDAEAIQVLQQAVDMGYQHFDTATLYGAGRSEELIGKALKSVRDSIFIASKGGMAQVQGEKQINGRPETLQRQCDASLKRLQTDYIDLYYLHRLDPDVPVEESVGALGELVKAGKIGAVGLSEVSATSLQRAHKEFTISAVQSEYSLWTRNPEIAVLDACQQLGITFVAFSPLGRGFLANSIRDLTQLEAGDMRHTMPRFSPANFAQNLSLLDGLQALANELNCRPAQLALAWLHAQGEHIVSIPGSRSAEHMAENIQAHSLELKPQQIQQLDKLINQATVMGHRYHPNQQKEVDSEDF